MNFILLREHRHQSKEKITKQTGPMGKFQKGFYEVKSLVNTEKVTHDRMITTIVFVEKSKVRIVNLREKTLIFNIHF